MSAGAEGAGAGIEGTGAVGAGAQSAGAGVEGAGTVGAGAHSAGAGIEGAGAVDAGTASSHDAAVVQNYSPCLRIQNEAANRRR